MACGLARNDCCWCRLAGVDGLALNVWLVLTGWFLVLTGCYQQADADWLVSKSWWWLVDWWRLTDWC
jgi:hypothetical protein